MRTRKPLPQRILETINQLGGEVKYGQLTQEFPEVFKGSLHAGLAALSEGGLIDVQWRRKAAENVWPGDPNPPFIAKIQITGRGRSRIK